MVGVCLWPRPLLVLTGAVSLPWGVPQVGRLMASPAFAPPHIQPFWQLCRGKSGRGYFSRQTRDLWRVGRQSPPQGSFQQSCHRQCEEALPPLPPRTPECLHTSLIDGTPGRTPVGRLCFTYLLTDCISLSAHTSHTGWQCFLKDFVGEALPLLHPLHVTKCLHTSHCCCLFEGLQKGGSASPASPLTPCPQCLHSAPQ